MLVAGDPSSPVSVATNVNENPRVMIVTATELETAPNVIADALVQADEQT
jgi:hypothetical protein